MRTECGTVSAICGMLKAPLDVLADKLRGYLGLAFDLMEVPEKVLAACEAMMPHLGYLALTGADPAKQVPIPIWMHRGCTPFISKEHFRTIYWPTLRPIVEALWAQGNQVLFYAEGKWDAHLETFAELPAGSMVYHIDRSDPALVHRILGKKFCLSGGVPNTLMAFASPEEVKPHCREADRNHRRRRRLHPGRERHHAKRRHRREPAGDDRGGARIWRVPVAIIAVAGSWRRRQTGRRRAFLDGPRLRGLSRACASRGRRNSGNCRPSPAIPRFRAACGMTSKGWRTSTSGTCY